ncbi:MAG: acyl carrier protein [Herminiimonas sp.]|nr:acyl carrier protein [Herminiimonas sp.]
MTTLSELKELIHKNFDIDPATLSVDAPLSDYGLDSLSLAELLFVIEDHFHLDFAEVPKDVGTLGALARLIDSQRLSQAA